MSSATAWRAKWRCTSSTMSSRRKQRPHSPRWRPTHAADGSCCTSWSLQRALSGSGNRVPAALTRAIDNLALAKEEASAVPMAVNLVADRPQSKSANVEHRLLYYRCESCSASGRRRPRRPFPDRRPSRHDGRSDRTSALATSLEAFPAPANGSRRSAFLCRNHRCLSVAMRLASSHVCN